MSAAWQVTSSQTLLKDRWIDLRADRCVTAAGTVIEPYYVLGYPDWVHVVALTDADELVLVRQYRHGAGAMVLELPGGCADAADADMEAAARRELLEETGFGAAEVRHVTTLFPNPATQSNRLHIMLATGLRREAAQSLDPGEDGLTIELLPLAEVLAGLQNGLIGQAMHVAGLLLGLAKAGRLKLGV
ncbi:NUDIX hydrolase [Bosea caraganae]|uniref:NUDIX hydrolase n=1 Tax=Bosea caraganae TaxID=2763117 RepID=A0A370L0S7_9HYPH|nr:NUDIX hydrolase [Bosea caraganae]RDJ20998.1 NUDIX hydrolase [Bosea caraganae]RDJ28497.1 NUDIX hydrolase [Bosea caraganae]